MSLREDMWKYEQITGESAEHVPIIKLGAFLDGYDMGIKALEQQPSEDCISREAVKEMLTEEWTKYMPMELDINLSFVMEKINELPSITPQPNTGHWILDETDNSITCSKCNCLIWANDIINGEPYYCPNCGARMENEETENE